MPVNYKILDKDRKVLQAINGSVCFGNLLNCLRLLESKEKPAYVEYTVTTEGKMHSLHSEAAVLWLQQLPKMPFFTIRVDAERATAYLENIITATVTVDITKSTYTALLAVFSYVRYIEEGVAIPYALRLYSLPHPGTLTVRHLLNAFLAARHARDIDRIMTGGGVYQRVLEKINIKNSHKETNTVFRYAQALSNSQRYEVFCPYDGHHIFRLSCVLDSAIGTLKGRKGSSIPTYLRRVFNYCNQDVKKMSQGNTRNRGVQDAYINNLTCTRKRAG